MLSMRALLAANDFINLSPSPEGTVEDMRDVPEETQVSCSCSLQIDGSFVPPLESAGTGFLLKAAGNEHLWMGGSYCKVSSPLMAETLALLNGLTTTKELHLSSIEINSNSMEVVNMAKGITPIPWSLRNLFQVIFLLFYSLTVTHIQHIPRSDNLVSHNLANIGRLQPTHFLFSSADPSASHFVAQP